MQKNRLRFPRRFLFEESVLYIYQYIILSTSNEYSIYFKVCCIVLFCIVKKKKNFSGVGLCSRSNQPTNRQYWYLVYIYRYSLGIVNTGIFFHAHMRIKNGDLQIKNFQFKMSLELYFTLLKSQTRKYVHLSSGMLHVISQFLGFMSSIH